MYAFDEDMVSDIYFKELKAAKKHKMLDREYVKRLDYLYECVEKIRESLPVEKRGEVEKLLGAIQIFNDYNEFKRFGNGMKYMYDLSMCLINKY